MKLKVELHPHQRTGAQFLVCRKAALLCYSTGSGKSLIQIVAAMTHVKKDRVDKFIFFGTKNSVISMGNDFKNLTDQNFVSVNTVDELRAFAESDERFAMVPYSRFKLWIFPRGCGKVKDSDPALRARITEVEEIFRSMGRFGICLDEFHTIKNPESQIRRSFDAFRHLFNYVYGATATAVMSSVYDFFHLMQFLDPGFAGGWIKFTEKFVELEEVTVRPYLKNGGRGLPKTRKVPVGFRNLDGLAQIARPLVQNYFPKADINFQTITTPLGKESWNLYETAAMGILGVDVEDIDLDADIDLGEDDGTKQHSVRLIDLQKTVNASHEKKSLLLQAVCDNLDRGVIVFVAFYETLDLLVDALDKAGIPNDSITGKRSSKDRESVMEWFTSDSTGKVLLITKAGGESLNLQATNLILFYDTPFGIGSFVQTMGRVVRLFSDHAQFDIFFLVAEDTVDQYKFELLASQKELITKMFQNRFAPEGRMESFDGRILRKLRHKFLWVANVKQELK